MVDTPLGEMTFNPRADKIVSFQKWAEAQPYSSAEFDIHSMATVSDMVDATLSLQKMIDSASTTQSTIRLQGKYYINSTLFLKSGVTIEGKTHGNRILLDYASETLFQNYGIIVLGPNGRIVSDIQQSWTLKNLIILSHSTAGPRYTNTAQILAEVESWWTRGVTALTVILSPDVNIEDCMIVGFKRAVGFHECERMLVRNLRIDCHAGVEIKQLYDLGRIENLHTWAFYTFGQDNDAVTSPRKGASLRLADRVDGITSFSHLSYGYKRSIHLDGRKWVRVGMVTGGSGYTSIPTVTVTGGDGTGATAFATLTPDGKVGHVLIDEPGTGWNSSPPIITISGGGGTGASAMTWIEDGSVYATKMSGFWLDHAISSQPVQQAIGILTEGQCREIVLDGHVDAHSTNVKWNHFSGTAGGINDIGLTVGIADKYQRHFVTGGGTSIGYESGGYGPNMLAINRVEATAGRWQFGPQKAGGSGTTPLWSLDANFDKTSFVFNDYYEAENSVQWDTASWATTIYAAMEVDLTYPPFDGVTERRIPMSAVATDSLNEYNPSLGIFTPKVRGYYSLDFNFSFLATGAGYLEFIVVVAGSELSGRIWRRDLSAGGVVADTLHLGLFMNPLQTFEIRIRTQGGGALIGRRGNTYFSTFRAYRHPRGRG